MSNLRFFNIFTYIHSKDDAKEPDSQDPWNNSFGNNSYLERTFSNKKVRKIYRMIQSCTV